MIEMGLIRCSECEGVLVKIAETDTSGREMAECSACRRRCIVVEFSGTAYLPPALDADDDDSPDGLP